MRERELMRTPRMLNFRMRRNGTCRMRHSESAEEYYCLIEAVKKKVFFGWCLKFNSSCNSIVNAENTEIRREHRDGFQNKPLPVFGIGLVNYERNCSVAWL